ncbi:MAG: hypothetical protein JJ992_04400, partial [Planctomycetes bacterium]|nr:hypothetical protein [Planctomycetota bacterium]
MRFGRWQIGWQAGEVPIGPSLRRFREESIQVPRKIGGRHVEDASKSRKGIHTDAIQFYRHRVEYLA